MSRHFELLYNMGVQLLHCGKPLAAFDCLVETVEAFQVNPRLWLRLAECCIMAHRPVSRHRRLFDRTRIVVAGNGIYVTRGLVRVLKNVYSYDNLDSRPGKSWNVWRWQVAAHLVRRVMS